MHTKEILAGEYLAKKRGTSNADTLVAGLKELYGYLAKEKQAETAKDTKHLSKVVPLLVKSHIVKAKTEKVLLYASCCLAEIIRIYAPNAPYTESNLEIIFRLFLNTLEDFHTKKDPLYSNLLLQLVRVKAFLLLIDLDMQLVRETFEQFLSLPVEDISPQDVTNLLNILALCVQTMAEDDDILDDDIVQTILICLLRKHDKRGRAVERHQSYTLAKNLVLHCTSELRNSITQIILTAIRNKGKGDTHLYRHYHDLIKEVNQIDSAIVVPVLPHLEKELKSDLKDIRIQVARTLSEVLSVSPSLFLSNRQLFDALLSRADDADPDVRRHVVDTCKTLLEYHPSCFAQVSHILTDRIMDTHETVRALAVQVICRAAEHSISNVQTELLEAVANRLIDSRPLVRMEAFAGLSSLYAETHPDDVSKADYAAKISWIPRKIIICYLYADWQIRFNVEQVVSEILPPSSEEADEDEGEDELESTRAEALLDAAMTFADEPQILAAYKKLLHEKSTFQVLFSQFIQATASVDVFEDVDEELFRKISHYFPKCPNLQGLLSNLTSMSNEVVKHFKVILDYKRPVEERMKAKFSAQECTKPFTTGKELSTEERQFFYALVEKASFTHITPRTIPHMFTHICSRLPQDSEKIPEEVRLLFQFLQAIAEEVPEYFNGCFFHLKTMLTDKNDFLIDTALSLLSHTAQTLAGQVFSNDLLDQLMDLCENGEPEQAARSVQSLARIHSNDNKAFNTTFESLLEKFTLYLVGGGAPAENMSTVVCSMSQVAELAPTNFAHHIDLLKPFLMETLFHEDLSYDAQTRMYGIDTLVNYALSLERTEGQRQGKEIVQHLVKILHDAGSIEEEEEDRSYLRKAAVLGLLKMAHKPHFDALISHEDFLVLARATRDPCYEVRSAMIALLTSGCRTVSLRVRYLSLLTVMINDPERELGKKAKEGLAACVERIRLIMKQKSSTPKIQLIRPELALPYLLFVITHAHDFEKDAPEYHVSSKYLQSFIEQMKSASSMYLFHFLDSMRKTQDMITPEYSERMYILCEIGKAIIKSKSPKKWTEAKDPVLLPPFYKGIHDAAILKQKLAKKYIGSSYHVPAPASRHPHQLGYPGFEDVEPYILDQDNIEAPKSINAIISPKKKRTRRPGKRKTAKSYKPRKARKIEEDSDSSSAPRRRSQRQRSQVSYDEETSSSSDADSDLSSEMEEE